MNSEATKFPVTLTFDLDGETLWTNFDPKNTDRPIVLSQGRYGPSTGLPKVLELLEKHEIMTTFFVPGWIVDRYPDRVWAIHDAGHEIAHHGYMHEFPQFIGSAEEEETLLIKGIKSIKNLIGERPFGYRAPGWEFSPHTMSLLNKHGFLYSSNFQDSDSPYRHKIDNKRTDIIELPVSWINSDTTFALYNLQLPTGKETPNTTIFEIWKEEFSSLYQEKAYYCLTLHPQVIGRPGRIRLLEKVIKFIKTNENVEFIRCIDLVQQISNSI